MSAKESVVVSSDVQTSKQVALRVQPHLDTVRSAAVETLRREPDRGRIAAAQRALATVREIAEEAGVEVLAAAAVIVGEALEIAGAEGADPALNLGHYASAAAADLTRIVHALLMDEDPAPLLEHARAMLRAMPRGELQQFIEVDLSDREFLAKVLATAPRPAMPNPPARRLVLPLADLQEIYVRLDAYAACVREITVAGRREALDELLAAAGALGDVATRMGVEQIERVMSAVCRVLEGFRTTEQSLTPDGVELAIAGQQIIPMILEALDDPARVARAVDALVEQASNLLIQVRRASEPLEEYWPEPDHAALAAAVGTKDHLLTAPPDGLGETLHLLDDSPPASAPDPEPLLTRPVGDATALFAEDAAALLPRLAEVVLALERDPGSPIVSRRLERTLLALRGAAAAAGLRWISEHAARMVALLDSADGNDRAALLREAHALSDALEQVILQANTEQPALRAARRTLRSDVEAVERLVAQASELAVRTGGHEYRSYRLAVATQDLRAGRDRIRDVARMLAERPADAADLAAELVALVADLSRAIDDLDHLRGEFDAGWRRQVHALGELDDGLRALRLVPFSALVPRLERAALGTARAAGTLVRFIVDGGSTEIDATLLEGVGAALLPLVRNAAQHGIEPPDVRRARGKPEEGTVRVRAERDGSQVVIQVCDDGAGIDDQEIARQAARSGFPVPPDGLTRERALQLLFMPGFGMKPSADGGPPRRSGIDTAGIAVSEIRGTITVESEVGRGTTFTIRVPLLPSLTEAPVVAVAGTRYVVPFVDASACDPSPEVIAVDGGGYVAQWDGDTLPVVDLGALLGVRSSEHAAAPGGRFIQVHHAGQRWLVRVDALFEPQAVMIRPQGLQGQGPVAPGVVATTAMPSGEVAQILDLAQVLDAARVPARGGPPTSVLRRAPVVLVADDSIGGRRAMVQALERDGWHVREARDGLEVRETLETTAPDLMVIDVDLPLLTAFRVVDAIQRHPDLPVIALMAHDDPGSQGHAQSLGARAALPRPCDTDTLLRTVREILPDRDGPGGNRD